MRSILRRGALQFSLDRTPGRRLRVGYVSADFRQHAVAMFAEPLLAAHDRSTCGALSLCGRRGRGLRRPNVFALLSDHWRNTIGLCDARLADQIRADQIDVLVDLAGHSAGNRLLTFARTAGAGAGGLSAGTRLQHRLVGHGCIPRRCRPRSRRRRCIVQRTPDPVAANTARVCAARWHAAGCTAAGADQRPRDVRPFRADRTPERRGDRDLVAHPARGAGRAAGVEQPAVPGTGIPRHVPARASPSTASIRSGSIWSTRRRSRAPGQPMAASTSPSIHFRTTPAQRRSRRCGRACRLCPWRAGRQSVGSAPASCMRSGWTTGSPTTPTLTWREPWPQHPTLRRSRQLRRDCGSVSPLRRCATQPASPGPSRRTYRMLWDEWREGDVPRLHRLYTRAIRLRQPNLAHRMLSA